MSRSSELITRIRCTRLSERASRSAPHLHASLPQSTILLLKADEEGLARAQQTLQLRSQECVLPQTRTKALIDLAAGPAAQLLSFSADPSQMAHEPPPPTHPAFIDVHTITASTRSLKVRSCLRRV